MLHVKTAKAREQRKQDLGVVKFKRGRMYETRKSHQIKMAKLFPHSHNNNGCNQEEKDDTQTQHHQQNNCHYRKITQEEVLRAHRKMRRTKAVGLNNIPIEVWKCLGDEGVHWLTVLFNIIFKTGKMPEQ